jgi:hypothetical protein
MADLVFMGSSPLTYIRNTNGIRYVMKNGELFDAATLDRLYPRQIKDAENVVEPVALCVLTSW